MKTILTLLSVVVFALGAHAQSRNIMDDEVPARIRYEFHKGHPTGVEVGWKQVDNAYIVEYTQNTFTSFALYTNEGILIETKDKISTFALPSTAYDYIKQNYGHVPLKEYFKSIDATSGIVTYSAKVKNQEIVFDTKGSYLKTVNFIL